MWSKTSHVSNFITPTVLYLAETPWGLETKERLKGLLLHKGETFSYGRLG